MESPDQEMDRLGLSPERLRFYATHYRGITHANADVMIECRASGEIGGETLRTVVDNYLSWAKNTPIYRDTDYEETLGKVIATFFVR